MRRVIGLFVLVLFLAACSYDEDGNLTLLGMDVHRDYCETHECLPLTARVHRPTVFKVEGVAADSNKRASLSVLSCELLPGESADSLFPACVDSVRFGNEKKLHQLRANDGRSQVFAYESIGGPVDEDNHFRFTFVDENRKEKSFDIDLNVYADMHKKMGDTVSFSFPRGLVKFEGITLDTAFDKTQLPLDAEYKLEEKCSTVWYNFDNHVDSILECRSYLNYVKPEDMKLEVRDGFSWRTVEKASDCKSPDTLFVRYSDAISKYMGCYRFTIKDSLESLTLTDLRSVKMLKEKYEADGVLRELLDDFWYGTWTAEFHLGNQGSMKTDSLIIVVNDPYDYYD